jgi:hypothetical protein
MKKGGIGSYVLAICTILPKDGGNTDRSGENEWIFDVSMHAKCLAAEGIDYGATARPLQDSRFTDPTYWNME